LARGFATLIRKRSTDDLAVWLEHACQSHCNEIRQFAVGLQQDLSAVTNAVSLSWSNDQTEGQVNRVKMIKRQMYGRAKFDLLRVRVMPRAKVM
jgi:transposase